MSTGTDRRLCTAVLYHEHGVSACDLAGGHDGNHGAWCAICEEDGYNYDATDRLRWDADGEDWTKRAPREAT